MNVQKELNKIAAEIESYSTRRAWVRGQELIPARNPANPKNPYEFGQAAFHKGIKAAPALDKDFMATLRNMGVKEMIKALTEWSRGWTEENVNAPY